MLRTGWPLCEGPVASSPHQSFSGNPEDVVLGQETLRRGEESSSLAENSLFLTRPGACQPLVGRHLLRVKSRLKQFGGGWCYEVPRGS